jgi:chlorobactene glucosyltransferase
MQRHDTDCLTVMPTQRTYTWSERLVAPLISFYTLSFLPEVGVRYVNHPAFATGNGQCLVFRRAAYEVIGGHAGVRASVIEDMSLARQIKSHRLKLVITQAGPLISTRMYSSWREVRQGFAKNLLALHGGQPTLLALSMAVQTGLFVAPFVWLAAGLHPAFHRPPILPGWPALPAAMVGLALGMRLLTASVSGARLRDAFLLPVSVALMLVIAAQSLWWHYRRGGPMWKGRRITIG